MGMNSMLGKISLKKWTIIAAIPLLWCAFFNHGFFASDEYWTGIARYIPAQSSSIDQLVEPDAVKSPSQLLPFYLMAKLALSIGMTEPYHQYVFLLSILGMISTFILLFSFYHYPGKELEIKIAVLLLGFHFATAVGFTRPMFESLSAAWVAAAAVLALRYDIRPSLRSLGFGILFSSIAFLLRPQAGVVALTFLAMPLWKKEWKHLGFSIFIGALCFVATGFLDLELMGEFHGSLKKVLFYNIKHGAEYGAQPFYYFLPLLFLLGFGFWTFKSYLNKDVQTAVLQQKSLLFMLGIFVLVHSLFANKFERFLIPILPVLVLLMIHPVKDILFSKMVSKLRKWSFLILNGLLLICTAGFEPQGPIISLARYANEHQALAKYISFKEAIHWYPEVFLNHSVSLEQVSNIASEISCDSVVVSRSFDVETLLAAHSGLKVLKTIQPGPIDWLSFKLNPEHNQRRAPLVLLGCGE
jgi:hypothetical protein